MSSTVCPRTAARKITAEVIDSERSIVFDQAENRLHAQKAILESRLIASLARDASATAERS